MNSVDAAFARQPMTRDRAVRIDDRYCELMSEITRRNYSAIEARDAITRLAGLAGAIPDLTHALRTAVEALEDIAGEHGRIKSGDMTRMYPPVHAQETIEQIGWNADGMADRSLEQARTLGREPSTNVARVDVPPSLRKAIESKWTYAAGMDDGSIVVFHRAELFGEFVRLHSCVPGGFVPEMLAGPIRGKTHSAFGLGPVFPRGLDVRLSDIAWCADDPVDGRLPETMHGAN